MEQEVETNNIDCNNNINNNEEPVLDNSNTDTSNIKSINQVFICKYCNKNIKVKKTFDKHVKEQLCLNIYKRTYCIQCKKDYNTNEKYKEHLLSIEHLTNINKETVCPILSNNKKNNADPYLNKEEAYTVNNSQLNSFTIIYNDNTSERKIINKNSINNQQNNTNNKIVSKDKKNNKNVSIDITLNKCNTYSKDEYINKNSGYSTSSDKSDSEVNSICSNEESEEDIEHTNFIKSRYEKIVTFLITNQTRDDCDTRFLKLLNKLNLLDYECLNSKLIKDSRVTVIAKQKYLKSIKTFINLLVKKKNNGNTHHNSILIEDIIVKITK